MPGIDFDRLRREIPMEEVLNLIDFVPTHRTGDQWYGQCPLHESNSRQSRSFSVNVATRLYCCHTCHRQGNQLDLWAAFTRLHLHTASSELCHALAREIPWTYRW